MNANLGILSHLDVCTFNLQMEKGIPMCTRITRAIPGNKPTPVSRIELKTKNTILLEQFKV